MSCCSSAWPWSACRSSCSKTARRYRTVFSFATIVIQCSRQTVDRGSRALRARDDRTWRSDDSLSSSWNQDRGPRHSPDLDDKSEGLAVTGHHRGSRALRARDDRTWRSDDSLSSSWNQDRGPGHSPDRDDKQRQAEDIFHRPTSFVIPDGRLRPPGIHDVPSAILNEPPSPPARSPYRKRRPVRRRPRLPSGLFSKPFFAREKRRRRRSATSATKTP